MPCLLRRSLPFVLLFILVAASAGADEAVISTGDGPVSITIRNTKPKSQAAKPPSTGAGTSTGPVSAPATPPTPGTGSEEHSEVMAVIQEVLSDYSSKNKYSELTETQCKQMSEAIWYRLRVKGVDVRLAAGNVKRNVVGVGIDMFVRFANHAWVMAKTPERGWLALECTNGSIVSRQENDLYYSGGLFFTTPEEVYKFDARRRDMYNASERLDKLVAKWNSKFKGKTLQKDSQLGKEREQLIQDIQRAKETLEDAAERLTTLYNNATVLADKGGN